MNKSSNIDVKLPQNLEALANDSINCVKKTSSSIILLLNPIYQLNIKNGVKTELTSRLKTYWDDFNGILLGFEDIKIQSPLSWLFEGNPYMHITISGIFYVFNPTVGSMLQGKVVKKSPNHVGCLVHGIFNVSCSIPPSMQRSDWCGTAVMEGDLLQMTITEVILTSLVPYLKADIIPESCEKPSCLSLLEDDSGISSNEKSCVDSSKKKKKKLQSTNSPEVGASSTLKKRKGKKFLAEFQESGNSFSPNDQVDHCESPMESKLTHSSSKKKSKKSLFSTSDTNLRASGCEGEVTPFKKTKRKKEKRHSSVVEDGHYPVENIPTNSSSGKKKKKPLTIPVPEMELSQEFSEEILPFKMKEGKKKRKKTEDTGGTSEHYCKKERKKSAAGSLKTEVATDSRNHEQTVARPFVESENKVKRNKQTNYHLPESNCVDNNESLSRKKKKKHSLSIVEKEVLTNSINEAAERSDFIAHKKSKKSSKIHLKRELNEPSDDIPSYSSKKRKLSDSGEIQGKRKKRKI